MFLSDFGSVERGGEFGVIGAPPEPHAVTLDGDDREASGPGAVEGVADLDARTGTEWLSRSLALVGGTHGR